MRPFWQGAGTVIILAVLALMFGTERSWDSTAPTTKWESQENKGIAQFKAKEYIQDHYSEVSTWSLRDWSVVHDGNGVYTVSVSSDLDLRSFGGVISRHFVCKVRGDLWRVSRCAGPGE